MKPHERLPALDAEEALERLAKHSFRHNDIEDPLMKLGFLGQLRPFTGSLYEDVIDDVISCIKSIGKTHLCSSNADASAMSSLWGICQLGRAWAVYPHGMLRRNNLISDEDILKMEHWLDAIGYAVTMYLDDQSDDVAMDPYDEYKNGHA